jgi:hypothetical protein
VTNAGRTVAVAVLDTALNTVIKDVEDRDKAARHGISERERSPIWLDPASSISVSVGLSKNISFLTLK